MPRLTLCVIARDEERMLPGCLASVRGIVDEIVVLAVTLKDGASASEDEIKAFLRERVASYKVPKRVLFFAEGEIPMTGSDTKVRDTELVALVAARLKGAEE